MALGRRYWTLWSSSALANLADGIFQVAVALVAVKLTRSPSLVAGVALAARLPWLFVALPAGALADRLDRRRTMVQANIVRVAFLGGLAVAHALGMSSIWLLYVVALGLGVAEVMFDTSSQTMMPALVDKDDLSRANGRLFGAELVMNQFVGPPIGGFLVAASAALAIGSSAGLYVLAAIALAMIPGSFRAAHAADAPRRRMRTEIAEGLRYLGGHRLLRTLGLLLGAQNLLLTASFSLFVLYLTSKTYGLGLSDTGVGLMLSVTAIGGFVGSFIGAPIEKRVGRATVLVIAVVVSGFGLMVPGLTRNLYIVAAAALFNGSASMWNVITVSLRQRIIPDELLGRVNSAYRLLGWGSMPIGAAVGGIVGQVLGVRPLFVLAGAIMLSLVIPLRLIVTDRAILAAEAEADARAAAEGEAEAEPALS